MVVLGVGALAMWAGGPTGASGPPFLRQLTQVSAVSSTVPANGDVNPYGVAVVPVSTGALVSGDILVSNFNAATNVQGTGTTIVQVAPGGGERLFAHIGTLPAGSTCPGGIGLTTALAVLPGGWVVVGSLPTGPGGALPKADPAGCLVVLDNEGTVAETLTNPDINGPWDMAWSTSAAGADLFVSNALGGNTKTHQGVPVAGQCTIVRLDLTLSSTAPPALTSSTVIGSDYPWRANSAALVLAPTGLALGSGGTLFVTNALTDTVSAIPGAATRTSAVAAAASVITRNGGLDAPLGMTLAPDGDLLIVNGDNGGATEVTPSGQQVARKVLIKDGAGDLFGLALTPDRHGIYFVNDGTNALSQARQRPAG
jgi:hypothetical protein